MGFHGAFLAVGDSGRLLPAATGGQRAEGPPATGDLQGSWQRCQAAPSGPLESHYRRVCLARSDPVLNLPMSINP